MTVNVISGAEAEEGDLQEFCRQVRALIAEHESEYALQLAEEQLEFAQQCGHGAWEAQASLLAALAHAAARPDEPGRTADLAQHAAECLRHVGDASGEVEVLRCKAQAFVAARHVDDAIAAARTAAERCRELGTSEVWTSTVVARALLFDGRPQEAAEAGRAAATRSREDGDAAGEVSAILVVAEALTAECNLEEAEQECEEALRLAELCLDPKSRAAAFTKLASVKCASKQQVKALRLVEKALPLWKKLDDPGSEVDALVVEALAKLEICQSRGPHSCNNTGLTVLASAKRALAQAQRWRSHDPACLGSALVVHSRALMQFESFTQAEMQLKIAAKAFRKARQWSSRGEALLLWSEASYKCGFLQDARAECRLALGLFEQFNRPDSLGQAQELSGRIDKALGIVPAVETFQQALEPDSPDASALSGSPLLGAQVPDPAIEPAATAVAARSTLSLTAGMDRSVILGKIVENVAALVGDDEPIEADFPLMEAGISSSTGVILRDQLKNDIPGISLPPTLIFDYPSMAEIAGYIADQVGS